jgi:hypothetical protein
VNSQIHNVDQCPLDCASRAQGGGRGEAIAWVRRGIEANRNFPLAHFYLSACLAWLCSVCWKKRTLLRALA